MIIALFLNTDSSLLRFPANLHITTLGHGYVSAQHVDHRCMFCDAAVPIDFLMVFDFQ